MRAPDRFAAVLVEVFARLDWVALGRHYCSEGGEERFGEAEVEELLDAEIAWSSRVVEALAESGAASGGRSLYVGAALSELGPMFGEALLLGREVLAFSLDNPETRELERRIAEVGAELDLPLPRIRTEDLTRARLPACDHLWLVSVLDDPDAFPALHDRLYEREGTELATGRGDLAADEERARGLCRAALSALAPPGLLTTSDEELAIVRSVAEARGLALEAAGEARLSPIVGDPVRTWSVRGRATRAR